VKTTVTLPTRLGRPEADTAQSFGGKNHSAASESHLLRKTLWMALEYQERRRGENLFAHDKELALEAILEIVALTHVQLLQYGKLRH